MLMYPDSIDDLIGVSFLDEGRDYTKGLDCWGLVMAAYYILKGIVLPDYKICAFDAKAVGEKIDSERLFGPWTPIEGPETAALVVIRNDPVIKNHTGICVSNKKFMHAMEKTGVVIEDINSIIWKRRISGYYRYASS